MTAKLLPIALALGFLTTAFARGQDAVGPPLALNLFNQYSTQGPALTQAGLYPAPYPTPANVGHTYYTYQPLYPHEHLYEHRRVYYNYYAPPSAFYTDPCSRHQPTGGALNKTTVVWHSGFNHFGPLPGSITPLANLYYRHAANKYGLRDEACFGGGCGY
jgi:hypothetical protein